MSALPILSFFKKGEEMRSIPLADEISVGRGDDCVIKLDDKAVSRNHALFRRVGKEVEVERKSEFAPILINGEEVSRKTLLDGDVIEIGPFRVKLKLPVEEKKIEKSNSPLMVDEVVDERFSPPPSQTKSIQNEKATSVINVDFTKQAKKNPDFEESQNDSSADVFSFDQKKSAKRAREENDLLSSTQSISAMSEPLPEDEPTRIQTKNVDARLHIPNGLAKQSEYELSEGTYTIGRGKGCDIVLLDKKSSRKNSEIHKEGDRYFIRDLDSSNGTFVNGKPIKDQELVHDDLIRIGEAQIRFTALHKSFEKKKEEIENSSEGVATSQIVVPMDTDGPSRSGLTGGFSTDFSGQIGITLDRGEKQSEDNASSTHRDSSLKDKPVKGLKELYLKYVRGYSSLKPVQKLIPLLTIAAIVSWYYFDDEENKTKTQNPQKSQQPSNAAKTPGNPSKSNGPSKPETITDGLTKTYNTLGVEEKKYVDTQMQIAEDAYRSGDYEKALYETGKLLKFLPDYDRAKEIQNYARAGKRINEVKEAEKKKKAEAERMRARIEELIEVATKAMSAKDYTSAQKTFEEIMTLDPENQKVSEWKKEIQTHEEEKSRREMELKVEREKNNFAKETFDEAMKLFKLGDYHAAIPLFEKVLDIRGTDKKVNSKAVEMKKLSYTSIKKLRDPLLAQAKAAETEGRLSEAYKYYEKSTKVDPPYPDGYTGMDRIRETLNSKSKAIYIEAIMLESYSDFKGAYTKFNEILKEAPEGSDYYNRAKRKLRAYQNYNPEEGG